MLFSFVKDILMEYLGKYFFMYQTISYLCLSCTFSENISVFTTDNSSLTKIQQICYEIYCNLGWPEPGIQPGTSENIELKLEIYYC